MRRVRDPYTAAVARLHAHLPRTSTLRKPRRRLVQLCVRTVWISFAIPLTGYKTERGDVPCSSTCAAEVSLWPVYGAREYSRCAQAPLACLRYSSARPAL